MLGASDPGHSEPPPAPQPPRRSFLRALGGLLAGFAVAPKADAAPQQQPVADTPAPSFEIEAAPDEDVLIRMQRDVHRALEKPESERRWGMVIDTRKCIGCSACTVGCVMENKLAPGVVYRPVIETEVGTYPNVSRRFLPRPCMQCENPPCVPVCPVEATWKRPDGVVEINYDVCIGCGYCLTACPYQARTFDYGMEWTDPAADGKDGALALTSARSYEELPSFEYGESWPRSEAAFLPGLFETSPKGNAHKCHFCVHRVEEGMLPMCVTTCIGRATFFGDLNDPEALVTSEAARPNSTRLKEELGTDPKVHYLV
jgi:Fe-S-cluster-containing dehydrogenase component